MKPVHLFRSLIIAILILVILTFLAGILHAFDSVRAASTITPTATPLIHAKNTAVFTPTPDLPSADTTGIIGLAIVIVVIVIIGTTLGGAKPRKKRSNKAK
jgi:hypothetical protein